MLSLKKLTSQRSSVNFYSFVERIIAKSFRLSKLRLKNMLILQLLKQCPLSQYLCGLQGMLIIASHLTTLFFYFAAAFNIAALSVASQVNSGSSRPKWP